MYTNQTLQSYTTNITHCSHYHQLTTLYQHILSLTSSHKQYCTALGVSLISFIAWHHFFSSAPSSIFLHLYLDTLNNSPELILSCDIYYIFIFSLCFYIMKGRCTQLHTITLFLNASQIVISLTSLTSLTLRISLDHFFLDSVSFARRDSSEIEK